MAINAIKLHRLLERPLMFYNFLITFVQSKFIKTAIPFACIMTYIDEAFARAVFCPILLYI